MKIEVTINVTDPHVITKLNQILAIVQGIQHQEAQELTDLTALTQAVENEKTVDESAIALLNGLSAQIASLKNDPAALQALADSLNTESASLAAAVAANTVPTP